MLRIPSFQPQTNPLEATEGGHRNPQAPQQGLTISSCSSRGPALLQAPQQPRPSPDEGAGQSHKAPGG